MKNTSIFFLLTLMISCSEMEIEESTVTQEIQATKLLANSGPCSFGYGNGSDSEPIGGGNGYSNIVSEQNAQHIVSNLAGLKTAVQNATNGDIIFINDTIEFTVPGEILHITKEVTLAGSRGSGDCGAVIKTGLFGTYEGGWLNNSKSKSYPVIKVSNSANVRITGLQFEGPFGGMEETGPRKLKHGVEIENAQNILIDNCEFRDWPFDAINVGLDATDNIVIKNNYFHDNVQHGLGYGVAIGDNAFALVKNNVFDNNRHDISCSGLQHSGYEFSFNICGQGSHPNVDTHGEKDLASNFTPQQPSDIAGSFFHVHHNRFLGDSTANILIRGIPEKLFMIEKNEFAHNHAANAIYHFAKKDSVYYNYDENVFAFNNSYDGNYQGYFVSSSYRKNQKIVHLPQNPALINNGQSTTFQPFQVMDFAIGDFKDDDTNTKNQIFIAKDQQWMVIDYPEPETMLLDSDRADYNWQGLVQGSGISPSNLIIGDFNGDKVSDVFKANGTNWAISDGGMTTWQNINTSTLGLTELKFGHFNGNNSNNEDTMDVFWANGTDWFLSDAATSGWVDINTSAFDYSQVGTGDFNGDGKMDVFTSSNGQFKYVNGGVGNWTVLAGSSIGLSGLLLYDIDNDGKTDVLRKYPNSDNEFRVMMNGISTNWNELTTSNYPDLLEAW